jgi:16S rRNA (cytidine1402-2'-O)-methyltransferase
LGTDREAVVALELTKRFERLAKGPLDALAGQFAVGETKGEAVILVAGAPDALPVPAADWHPALAAALAEKPLRSAVDDIAARYGLKRKEVYDQALAFKSGRP